MIFMVRAAYKNEALLRAAVVGANSITDVIRHLGYDIGGGTHAAVKKWADIYSIELPSYVGSAAQHEVLERGRRKFSNEEIFTPESVVNRRRVKQALLETGTPYICSECGQKPEWNGKPLRLQLDHINGVNNDNRIENLRILCGHCHSQTETFAGRNARKNILESNHCSDCGANISRKATRCRSCSSRVFRGVADYPKIEDLKIMIESLGYTETGRRLGVSDNAVRKHYNKHL